MKRYLTIDAATLKKCLKAADEDSCGFDQSVCKICPARESEWRAGRIDDPCWLSIYNWLVEDIEVRGVGNPIFETPAYQEGFDNGWDQGRRHLVKQIEEKAGIIRKERDRK